MVDVSLTQGMIKDPSLGESLRSAQTSDKKFQILEKAGFSKSQILKATTEPASRFFSGTVFRGKFGSLGY